MNDTGDKPPLTAAERACFHIVRRVQESASFAWVMVGTESLELCVQAVADRRREPFEKVARRVTENAASQHETPEVVKLRRRVEDLERAQRSTQQLAEATGCCQHRDTVSALKELVRLAECGCDVLTIENVKEVLRIPARVHVVR